MASLMDTLPSCDTVLLAGGEKIWFRWLAKRRARGAERGGIVDGHVALV